MNKKVLIDKWKSKTGAPAYEISDLPINSSKIEMYIAGYGVARKEILEDLKQLDEPQKHVMPKFVADWFKDNKHALDLAIFTKIRELDGKRYPHETDFENWLDNAENNPIETPIRMKDGPRGAIFEADGGAWRNQAIVNIREYLYEQLEEEIKSKRVTILA